MTPGTDGMIADLGWLYGFFYVVVASTLGAGIFLLVRLLRHRRFPVVSGTLLDKRIEKAWTNTSEGSDWTYYAIVAYTYHVEGRAYSSDRLYDLCPRGFATAWGARQAVASLQAGHSVKVFYDPARPDFAFLLFGPAMAIWLPMLIGLCFSGMAWYVGFRR